MLQARPIENIIVWLWTVSATITAVVCGGGGPTPIGLSQERTRLGLLTRRGDVVVVAAEGSWRHGDTETVILRSVDAARYLGISTTSPLLCLSDLDDVQCKFDELIEVEC